MTPGSPGFRRLLTALCYAAIVAAPIAALTPSGQSPTWPVDRPTRHHQEGDAVTILFQVTNHQQVQPSYSASNLPPGLSINAATGLVSGTLVESTRNQIDGAAGTREVTITAISSGGSASYQFTWRVSRFRSGDVFAGIGLGRYRVFDENGIEKYTLQAETQEEWEASGAGGMGTTTGCGYNWVSRRMYFTSFDVDHDPHVIEIDPVPAAGGEAFPRNRISTFRDSGRTADGIPISIDNAPESVVFDGQGNMYVGHAGGYYNEEWYPADASNRPLVTEAENGFDFIYLDVTGQPLLSNGAPILFPQGYSRTGVLERWPGEPWPGNPMGLIQWGRDIQQFLYDSVTGQLTRGAVFDPHASWQGSDWIDLASDQRTLFYTSEWGVVHRYDVGADPAGGVRQLPDYATLPPVDGRSQTLYALRVLPPGDGSGGVLVAAPAELLRLTADNRVVMRYDAGVDGWFGLNISPDGKSVWSGSTVNGRIYKWDIATARLLPLGSSAGFGGIFSGAEVVQVHELTQEPTRYSLDGMCVMGEYTAAQEICGNNIDDDGDGLIDENCQPIEICSTLSPGDDDGDGLVDSNDPDCGAVNICSATGPTDPSVAGFCARFNYEGDSVLVLPAPGPPEHQPLRDVYTITGSPSLPPGITYDASGVLSGSPLYTTLLNTDVPNTRVYRITFDVRREQLDGTLVATYTQSFDWTIENRNRPPVALDDARTTRPGVAVAVNVLDNDSDPDAEDTPVIIASTSPSSGTAVRAGGTFTYTPNPGFVGVDSFTYTIADGHGGTATATVAIAVVNSPPVAVDDAVTARPGLAVGIAVLDNDTDADNDTLEVTAHTNPSNGTVTRSGNTFSYTSTAGFTGADAFTYTISDGYGGTGTATVRIAVVNQPPHAADDAAATIAGFSSGPIAVLENDSDPDNDPLTITAFTQPSNGTVARVGDTFIYTPASSFVGVDAFTYTIADGFGGTDTATVALTVTNRPPVAVDDAATARATTPVTVPVLANDSDPDGHEISLVSATSPSNGVAVVNAGGTITYTANGGFQGIDTFSYTIRDFYGAQASALVTITVGPANRFDACTCAAAKASLGEIWPPNHKKTEVVNITNVIDPDGGPVAITILGIYQDEPTNYLGDGDTAIDGGGVGTSSAWVRAERTGNPNAGDNGRVYEIVFEATAADGSNCQGAVFTGVPHDQGQGRYVWDDGIRYDSTVAGGPVVREAMKTERHLSDADVAARGFVPKFVAEARIGAPGPATEMQIGPSLAAPAASEQFTWTSGEQVLFMLWRMGSTTNFVLISGNQFKYVTTQVECANGECNDLFLRAEADGGRVTLSSIAVNGRPLPDTVTIPIGGDPRSLRLTGMMTDAGVVLTGLAKLEWSTPVPTGSALNFRIMGGKACPPEGGTGGGGGLGTPPLARGDAYSTDEDTPLQVDVQAGVLGNDLTFGGALSAAIVEATTRGALNLQPDGSFTYSPEPNFHGTDTFLYKAVDGALESEAALVTITVNPVPDLPLAVNDAATTDENVPVTIHVLANDSDPMGGPLTIQSITQPANGTAVVSGSGIVYTPAHQFVGVNTFTYTVQGAEGSATAVVTVTVRNVNDPPVAVNDAYTTPEDTTLTVAAPGVKGNDSDPDPGDTFDALLVAQPQHGTLTLNASGAFTYTPAANYNGPDAFTYRLRDAGGLFSGTATVSLTVTPVNDPPVAVNDSWVMNEDGVLQVNAPGVKANDSDVDTPMASVTVTLVSGVQRGTLTLNADGSFVYTPFPNVSGADSFTYRLNDGSLNSNVATVTIAITEVPDPPQAMDDAVTTPEDTAVVINVLANDTDPDTAPGDLTLVSVTQPANGTAAIVSGQVLYTPALNFNGQDVFSYTISDGQGTSTAQVIVTVTPVNDPPVAAPDSYSTAKRTLLTVPAPGVLANDTDPDGGQPLTARVISQPANGTLTLQSNGAFSYQPTGGFVGIDTFVYRINDGVVDGNTAAVTITVTGTNDPPVAADDTYTMDQGAVVTIAAPGVLANDSDPDGDALSAALVGAPSSGTLTLNPNGSFTYTPTPDFAGTVTFTYRAGDGSETSNPATVTINVTVPQHSQSCSISGPIGGVPLGSLTRNLFFFSNGSSDAVWQGASKGYVGNVLVNGVAANQKTSGTVPYAGAVTTNAASLGSWQGIVTNNSTQASAVFGRTALVQQAADDLSIALAYISGLPATAGYANRSSASLNGINTQNNVAETIVINVTTGFSISSRLFITGDAGDVFVMRWDTNANPADGYQGVVKFSSGGAIVPQGGLTPANFIHVAGEVDASGGGTNPPAPYPQGPRLNGGQGTLIAGASNFNGGGFFTGYWLTTGNNKGDNGSLSNGIFVGGWYSAAKKFSLTSGSSGVLVCPNPAAIR
jgi:VCBS repeat-containing protein